MKKSSLWVLAAVLAAVFIAGCQSQRAPAEQAVAAAESALTSIRDMATHYAPDELQAVDAQLASVKDQLAKGDYKGVMAAMPALNTAIGNLKDTATAKQADAEAASAKASVDSMKATWSEASNAATSGDYTTAVTKGQAVKDQATQVMHSLGMTAS